MSKLNDKLDNISSEFTGDEKKLLNKILDEKIPDFDTNPKFKEELDNKLKNRIDLAKEQFQEKKELDSVPTKLKWRFYVTGFGYAVCGFLFLFLIGFCTDLFTGTLKVPQKYSYSDDIAAFGQVDALGTTNTYETDEIKIYGENSEESAEVLSADKEYTISNKLLRYNTKDVKQESDSNEINYAFNTVNTVSYDAYDDSILNDLVVYGTTYRFSYKDKLFPKLLTEYPIYKSSGILMRENASNQIIKGLKIGNISMKNFTGLEILNFELSQKGNNGYNIIFRADDKSLSFYPNSERKSQPYDGKLPSNKQIIKSVENKLRQLGISTNNYGDGIVDVENFDNDMGIIQIFYPFEIQGKTVWNPDTNQQIGMHIAYDMNADLMVSVINYDIATYEASNYYTLDKQEIENGIEQGGEFYFQGALHSNSTVVLFDSMEIVFIEKLGEDGNIYYIPAIKGNVSTSLENYIGPKYIFQGIVK